MIETERSTSTTTEGTTQVGAVATAKNGFSFDPVQSALALEKAREARRANAARLRSNFPPCDEQNWTELAEQYGIRLPMYGMPITTALLKRYLSKLGIKATDYQAWYGEKRETLATIVRGYDAIGWPAKAVIGLVLEARSTGRL